VIPMDRQGDSYIPKTNVFAGGYNNPGNTTSQHNGQFKRQGF